MRCHAKRHDIFLHLESPGVRIWMNPAIFQEHKSILQCREMTKQSCCHLHTRFRVKRQILPVAYPADSQLRACTTDV
eukprot:8907498-Pyramimonas_sp.AAC.1